MTGIHPNDFLLPSLYFLNSNRHSRFWLSHIIINNIIIYININNINGTVRHTMAEGRVLGAAPILNM